MNTETKTDDTVQQQDIPDAAPPPTQQRMPQQTKRTALDLPDVNLVDASPFVSMHAFTVASKMAAVLAASSMVPDTYRQWVYDKDSASWQENPNAIGNCVIAIDLSNRLGINVLETMQNVDVIYGRPALRAKLITGLVNARAGNLFQHELRYENNGLTGDDYGWRAWTTAMDGSRLEGPWITWKLVKAEGWSNRKGNKWNTMPEKMFCYRAASWWADIHGTHITLGLMSSEEVADAYSEEERPTRAQLLNDRLAEPEPLALPQEAAAPETFEATTTKDPEPERKPRGTRRKVKDAPDPTPEPEPAGEDDGTGPEPPPADEAAPDRVDDQTAAPATTPQQTAFNVE